MSTPSPSAKPSARGLTHTLEVKTTRHTELVDAEVARLVAAAGVDHGVCHLSVPHTTAGLTINENDDPNVARDLEAAFDRLAPRDASYRHTERNADSHVKSTLAGVSQTVFIEDGRLGLGRWQGIFFFEFDGPRPRPLRVKNVPDRSE